MVISVDQLLADWYQRIRFVQFCHYEAAKLYDRLNYALGIPVIGLSTLVGSSVFSQMGQSIEHWFQVGIGLTSFLAAVLASLQTFFKFSEKSERHRIAAAKYGALRREIEEILATHPQPDREVVNTLRQKLDRLADEAPPIPDRIWSRRQQVLTEDKQRSVGLQPQS